MQTPDTNLLQEYAETRAFMAKVVDDLIAGHEPGKDVLIAAAMLASGLQVAIPDPMKINDPRLGMSLLEFGRAMGEFVKLVQQTQAAAAEGTPV